MHITVCIYDFVPVMSLTEDQCCTETWCTISLVLSLYHSRWKFDADFYNSYYLSSSLLLRIFHCPDTMSGWNRAIQLLC